MSKAIVPPSEPASNVVRLSEWKEARKRAQEARETEVLNRALIAETDEGSPEAKAEAEAVARFTDWAQRQLTPIFRRGVETLGLPPCVIADLLELPIDTLAGGECAPSCVHHNPRLAEHV
jgi:hypothetical protein